MSYLSYLDYYEIYFYIILGGFLVNNVYILEFFLQVWGCYFFGKDRDELVIKGYLTNLALIFLITLVGLVLIMLILD